MCNVVVNDFSNIRENDPAKCQEQRNRDDGIDTLRGLAILLIVIGHAEGGRFGAHLPAIQYLNDSLFMVRIPLFAAIAGFVYAMRSGNSRSSVNFVRGKAQRILVPMVCVAAIPFVFRIESPFVEPPSQMIEAWRVFIFPYRHLWFLQAVFVAFVLVAALDYLRFLTKARSWFVTVFVTAVLFLLTPTQFWDVRVFSLNRLPYVFFFFLLGLGLWRFRNQIFLPAVLTMAFTFFAVGEILHQLTLLGVVDVPLFRTGPLALVVGSSAVVLAITYRRSVKWLSFIGGFSYSVYLFHWAILGLVAHGISLVGFELPSVAKFLALVSSAVVGSIFAHQLFARTSLTRMLFLGLN